ncbi:ABC transporter substrate-binding protein [Modestobacter sp. KNN46-3]|uniref:ABC transporter substrate-binding protein n=1 Tax=Modestobacter sp. KNN46-3 TaxID=2711218 RepID=UPI0019D1B758|nr:ABC transporter substrate-binding protein [Modestobacter sp. KNN46-3]
MLGNKRVGIAAIALAASLVMTACGSSDGGGSDGGAEGGGTLTLGSIFAPQTLAASGAEWANVSPYIQSVYDSLLRETPDAEVEPWLATEWSYNEDKTVLTMQLRDDVTFTDGEKFTADVAAQNLLRFKAGTSPNASFLASVADAKATDEYTLEITLTAPDPALLNYLAQNAGAQASPATFAAPDAATDPVGSGPYIFNADRTVVGSSYVFDRNPEYWAGAEEQHYDQVVINVLDNPQAQLSAIQGGQVNGLNLFDNSALDQIEGAGFTAYPHELDWQGLILFDRAGTMAPALGDVRVRQAINHAVDRDALLKAVVQGYGTATTQVFDESSAAYVEELDERYPYDPELARELLAEAGYAEGFTLSMPNVNLGSTTAADLTAQYLGDVGITVQYDQLSLQEAIAALLAPKYPASWIQLQSDPTAWQLANFALTPTASWNPFRVEDPKVAELVSTLQSGTEEEAEQAGQELNEYIVQQAWFAPYYRVESTFVADGDTDVVHQSNNAYPLLQYITPKG